MAALVNPVVSTYPEPQVSFVLSEQDDFEGREKNFSDRWVFTPSSSLEETTIEKIDIDRQHTGILSIALYMKEAGFQKMRDYLELKGIEFSGIEFTKLDYSFNVIEHSSACRLIKLLLDNNTFKDSDKDALMKAMNFPLIYLIELPNLVKVDKE